MLPELLKAPAAIEVTLAGIVRVFNEVQPPNVLWSILVSFSYK